MKPNSIVFLIDPPPLVREACVDSLPAENFHKELKITNGDFEQVVSAWEMSVFHLQKIYEHACVAGFNSDFKVAARRQNKQSVRFLKKEEWSNKEKNKKKRERQVSKVLEKIQMTFEFMHQ